MLLCSHTQSAVFGAGCLCFRELEYFLLRDLTHLTPSHSQLRLSTRGSSLISCVACGRAGGPIVLIVLPSLPTLSYHSTLETTEALEKYLEPPNDWFLKNCVRLVAWRVFPSARCGCAQATDDSITMVLSLWKHAWMRHQTVPHIHYPVLLYIWTHQSVPVISGAFFRREQVSGKGPRKCRNADNRFLEIVWLGVVLQGNLFGTTIWNFFKLFEGSLIKLMN